MTNHNEHYFTAQPQSTGAARSYSFHVRQKKYTVTTETGVFSSDRLDKGTAVLLDSFDSGKIELPSDFDGDIVDLGCGAGPLTLVLASTFPEQQVWAIDVNERARELCKANAKAMSLSNVTVASPDAVPIDMSISLLWSNPPIRIGKNALHQLLLEWLPRLSETGIAHLVINKNLGADSLANWLVDQEFTVRRSASSKGFRVLSVTRGIHLDT